MNIYWKKTKTIITETKPKPLKVFTRSEFIDIFLIRILDKNIAITLGNTLPYDKVRVYAVTRFTVTIGKYNTNKHKFKTTRFVFPFMGKARFALT